MTDQELRIEELLDEIAELDAELADCSIGPLSKWATARRTYLQTLVKELLK